VAEEQVPATAGTVELCRTCVGHGRAIVLRGGQKTNCLPGGRDGAAPNMPEMRVTLSFGLHPEKGTTALRTLCCSAH